MKHLIVTCVISAMAFTALPAQAQQATANAGSQSASTSQSSSGSQSSIVFNTPSQQTVRQAGSSTTRVESAPSLGGLALGGGHPCAYSPATGQISIIGGGAGFGGAQIDTACMLLIQAAANGDQRAYNAAIFMLAARDAEACKAMYMAGMVDDCVNKQGKSTVKAAPTVTSRNTAATVNVAYAKCEKNGNKITFTRKSGADSAVAKAQCLASLGF